MLRCKRLQKNEPLQKVYYAQILDYIQKRQVEIALTEGDPDTFYLPHQAVQKEKHGNIKWRIVLDASSHEHNEVLEMASHQQPNSEQEITDTEFKILHSYSKILHSCRHLFILTCILMCTINV